MKYFTAVCLKLFIVLIAFQTETHASIRCEALFQKQMEPAAVKTGVQVLHEKDSKLHTSVSVERIVEKYKITTRKVLNKPTDKLNQWFDYLTRLSKKADTSKSTLNYVKSVLNNQYVIKSNEVPESYYDLQIRIARDRGHGDITLSKEQKIQLAETVIADQKKSIEVWIEYLVSKDTSMYPMWVKYWMFTGMTRLSKYDLATGSFGNRDKSTVAPFVELNREALAIVADAVLKYVNKKSLEDLNDPEFEKLLPGLNFSKLYGRVLFKLGVGKEGAFKTNLGKWIIYAKGADHMPLVKSLEGRNTGWCTAGESTAKSQLSQGDFHVYYSLDDIGLPTIPRVAIRMTGNEIAEVRGVAKDQNLDAQINGSDVISSKMKEFGDKGKKFEKKDRDMKMLTQIEKHHKLGQDLSKEELKFLYEVEQKIEGFGYEKDPRIEKVKSERDLKSDLVVVFDYKYTRDEISTTEAEALSGKAKIHYGDLDLSRLTSAVGLKLPDMIIGDLDLRGLRSIIGLKLPNTVNGNLSLDGLSSAVGLKLPDTMSGDLVLSGISSAAGLKLPNTMNGGFDLSGLKSASGLNLPDTMNGSLFLSGLKSATGLKLPDTINGSLYLRGLTSGVGLKLPDAMNGDLDLSGLTSGVGLKLPHAMNGTLDLRGLTSGVGLELPDVMNGSLYLNGLTSGVGLKLPDTMNGTLYFSGLRSAAELKLPSMMNGNLSLNGLTSAVGLKLPDVMNGSLDLYGLTSGVGLKLPDVMNGSLYLNGLTSGVGLKLPDTINGSLYLGGLRSVVGLKLPSVIVGNLFLIRLTSAAGLKRPKQVNSIFGPDDFDR